ncbi:MAG TPA: hypothetical protein VNL98_10480 [Gemmatimonadales bacterium]|nr:hypothetical protein [Gemmatimonadales bacterium]
MVVPFRLKVPDETKVRGPEVTTVRHDLRGLARMEAGELVLEWTGKRSVGELGPASIRTKDETVAPTLVRLPVAGIGRVSVRSTLWFRNRIEILLRNLKDAPVIPGSPPGRVVLWIARSDREAAEELAAAIESDLADLALRAAEGERQLPPP